MVDPDWGNEDPDAAKVKRMSSGYNTPPTQSSYPASAVPAVSTSTQAHPVPPRLPPRFKSDASSVSAYSSADDGESPSTQPLPPPNPSHLPASTGGSAVGDSGMDESERREYEQHLEMLKYEADLAAAGDGQAVTVASHQEGIVPTSTTISGPGFGAGAGDKADDVDLPPTYMHSSGAADQQIQQQEDLGRQMQKMSVTGTSTSK
jgi:hypothetical protein